MHNEERVSKLANIIRFHRKRSGLSRVELARYAGVGKTVIFDIEHSKTTIQLDTLLKIFNILNITIEFNSPLMESLYQEEQDAQS